MACAVAPSWLLIPVDHTLSSGSGGDESDGRLVLTSLEGQQRLEIGSSGLSTTLGQEGPLPTGPIRFPQQQADSGLLQLATGSGEFSGGRVSPTVASQGSVRLSPFQHDRTDNSIPEESTHFSPARRSALAESTVVPGPSGALLHRSVASTVFPDAPHGPERESAFPGTRGPSPSGGLGSFRGAWQTSDLSQAARDLIWDSWAPGTRRCYLSAWDSWSSWCCERDFDPFTAPVTAILNFLSHLFSLGRSYRSLNVVRSAISAAHVPSLGIPIGRDPLVCRLLRGIRLQRPPGPRYSRLWDVALVLQFLRDWPTNTSLSLRQLSAKLTLLLCLVSFRRVSDVRAFDVDAFSVSPEGVTFRVSRRTKSNSTSVFYPFFASEPQLCVVSTLTRYVEVTSALRTSASGQLLVSYVRPHVPVSTTTLARWIRWLLSLAGVDPCFGAHSVRGAAASSAFSAGASLTDILHSADWSRESTFRTFYFRPSTGAAMCLVNQR